MYFGGVCLCEYCCCNQYSSPTAVIGNIAIIIALIMNIANALFVNIAMTKIKDLS